MLSRTGWIITFRLTAGIRWPSVVEDMIRGRLEERSLAVMQGALFEDGLWPATFYPDE